MCLIVAPPSYGQVTGPWPGEGTTSTAGSDTEVKGHGHHPLKVIGNGDAGPKSILYDRSSPRGSPKVPPDLPPKPEVRFNLSHFPPRPTPGQGQGQGQGSPPRGQSGSPQSSPDLIKSMADTELSVYDSVPRHALLAGNHTSKPLLCFQKVFCAFVISPFFFLVCFFSFFLFSSFSFFYSTCGCIVGWGVRQGCWRN